VFLEKLGHDVVLLLDLGLQLFDLLVFRCVLSTHVMTIGLALEDNGTLFEELLLPLIELNSMNLVLIHERRDWDTLQEVFPYNRDLLLRR
jgi:hypothetical protein